MKKLSIILPTEAKLEESENNGLLSRWRFYFSELSKHFELDVFSCDTKNYSESLKIKHHPLPFSFFFIPFGNQILYNFYLLFLSFKMTKVIRIVSASYFTLPFLKLFGKKIILSYSYDYATTTKKDFGGFKGITSGFREWLSIKSAKIIICTTQELSNKIKIKYGKGSVIIPNFVNTNNFAPAKKNNTILYAGRIYWHKGIDYLIEAFKKVETIFPELKLQLAGTGEIDNYVEKAKNLKIKNIEFLGKIDNDKINSIMGSAKIFILPSLHREGQPKALIEAMACGCACIATNVDGNKDLIINRETGLLVNPKDKNDIVKAITEICNDSFLYEKISTNAKLKAKFFSIGNTLGKEIELLKNY